MFEAVSMGAVSVLCQQIIQGLLHPFDLVLVHLPFF